MVVRERRKDCEGVAILSVVRIGLGWSLSCVADVADVVDVEGFVTGCDAGWSYSSCQRSSIGNLGGARRHLQGFKIHDRGARSFFVHNWGNHSRSAHNPRPPCPVESK